jgi:hypothetical protein
MDGTCSTHGEVRNLYKIVVGKTERKIPLGRPRHRWDLREIVVSWFNLAQNRDQ